MNPTFVLKKPLITEKSLSEAGRGLFTFQVPPSATKTQIKHAVEATFTVDVVSVRTTTSPARLKRIGQKRLPRLQPATKKARVQLKPGQKIELFDIEESNN